MEEENELTKQLYDFPFDTDDETYYWLNDELITEINRILNHYDEIQKEVREIIRSYRPDLLKFEKILDLLNKRGKLTNDS